MFWTVVLAVFFVGFPVLVLWLGERKMLFVDRIGAVVVCYAVGLLIGNAGILPDGAGAAQDALSTVAVPIALPLMFFSIDIGKWSRTGGKFLLSFALETVAVVIVSVIGYFAFRGSIGPETYKLTGMLNGVYTGGTINLASIGTALGVSPTIYVAANAADIVLSGLYLLFLVSVGKKLLGKMLPAWKADAAAGEEAGGDYDSYKGIFKRGTALPLLGALGLALLIFAVGACFTLLDLGQWGTILTVLAITSISIGASFVPRIRRIRKTYQLGQYFILVFVLAVGSMANLGQLARALPGVIAYVALAIFGSLVIHALLCAVFRIDVDTMIITSVAGVCSPPFVPMVAASLKNRAVIMPGVIVGIIGWVIGTYLGIGVSTAIAALGI
jgi:uncharacterized membrane protein